MSRASLDLDALVDATPTSRDRVIDLMRVVSICVVVAWHWTFSITHWHDGRLVMPNPIADVPGLWAATWVLQVMPVFFVVGGHANLAGWQAVERDGTGAARFVRRLARLTKPLLPWLACWVIFDLAAQAGGGRSVASWGRVVFVPLWFIGVYALVIVAVPVSARLHAAHRGRVLVAMGAGILAADALRLGTDVGGPVPCWPMTALVSFLWLYEWAGFTPMADPTAAWWLSRPLWLAGPALVLAAALAAPAAFRRRTPQ